MRLAPNSSDGPGQELDLQLPATAEQVGRVRHRIGPLAVAAGLSDVARRDVALVVSEACANVVVHAYAASETAPEDRVLLIRAHVRPGVLEIEVGDHGTGMAARTDSPGLGLGLPLISSLADEVEIRAAEPAGTRIVLRFATDRAAPAARAAGGHLRSVG